MRKQIIAIIIILVILALTAVWYFSFRSNQSNTTSPQSSITPTISQTNITFPSGGETLVQGQTYTLKWTGGPNPTQIFLINTALESQGQSVSIVDRKYNVQNTGSFQYTVPTTLDNGTYKFEIGTATSNPFQITNSKNSNTLSYCQPNDLQAKLQTEGAAGSIYGTATLKNTSSQKCQISGNNFTQPSTPAQNITVINQGNAGQSTLVLNPNETVYSQVRYENGPQCTATQTSNVSFNYKISPSESVTFQNANGDTKQNLIVCTSPSEKTKIWVWSVSTSPITP